MMEDVSVFSEIFFRVVVTQSRGQTREPRISREIRRRVLISEAQGKQNVDPSSNSAQPELKIGFPGDMIEWGERLTDNGSILAALDLSSPRYPPRWCN